MTKEQEILNAAEEEFFRNGYDATSTAVIAKRAGVTHAMVNYYFRSKEEILEYVTKEFGYDISETLDQMRERHEHVESCQDSLPKALKSFFDGKNLFFMVY